MSREHMIVTPEAVVLDLDTAGLGSRFVAALVDGLLHGVPSLLLLVLALGLTGGLWITIALALAAAFVPVAYGAIFEGLWNGRTPGKRANKLRVVQTNGHPITWKQAIVRNLFRLLDAYVGAFFVLATRRSQRLGDLAAGTMVVREPSEAAPQPFSLSSDPVQEALALRIDASAIGAREHGMLRDFLRRRDGLASSGRQAVARQLADLVRARVPLPPDEPVPDELLIEAAVAAVQARMAVPADAGPASADVGPAPDEL